MNIVTQFNKLLEKSFNIFLKKYFKDSNYWDKESNIINYISFMTDLDKFSTTFILNVIKSYFEYIDNIFFKSSYRKNFCSSKGFYERTILTLFGEVTIKRRYYYDNKTNDKFFFTDLFLGIPKRKYFDPFICAEICNESASSNYSKSGKIIASKIGNRINNNITISRATSRNIVIGFDIPDIKEQREKEIERLFVMLDEKYVGSQFNDNKDHMIKAAVIFEDTELVYKSKKKKDSIDRYKLVNSYTCASIENKLLSDTVDYIYNTYNTDKIKEIYFMGDCATWIKNFPKSHWFNFNPKSIVYFSMDGFHFSQALKQLTTNKNKDVYDALYEYVLKNDKKEFINMCNDFNELYPERTETIENKMNYILKNWGPRQLYQSKSFLKCSMESHISHIFADIFTSRPKAYSKKGLKQLLKLRLLKVNKQNIKELYLNSLNSNTILTIKQDKISFSIFDKSSNNFNPLSLINEPIYSKPFDTAYFYTYK